MAMTDTQPRSLTERLEPYIAIIGPMVMILAILLFMGIVEPPRYFRTTNLNLILLDAALYMPMAMAMTFVITQRGIDLSIGSIAALSGIIMAFLIKQYGGSVYIAVPIAISLGAVMGLINYMVVMVVICLCLNPYLLLTMLTKSTVLMLVRMMPIGELKKFTQGI